MNSRRRISDLPLIVRANGHGAVAVDVQVIWQEDSKEVEEMTRPRL
jgi:hypothetical protein